jgi:hypothetical protein
MKHALYIGEAWGLEDLMNSLLERDMSNFVLAPDGKKIDVVCQYTSLTPRKIAKLKNEYKNQGKAVKLYNDAHGKPFALKIDYSQDYVLTIADEKRARRMPHLDEIFRGRWPPYGIDAGITKPEVLANLKQTYCRIKPSFLHGVGVFAIRTISKGKNPFPGCDNIDFKKISEQEFKSLPLEVQKIVRSFCALKKGYYGVPVFGMNGMDMSWYVNHSVTPNLRLKTIGDNDVFVALRRIRKGEELTADYTAYYGVISIE